MITKGFLTIVYLFLYAITAPFRILPNVSLPATLLDPITTAGHYAISLDHFFPVHELFWIIVGVFVVFEIAVLAWKFINWVIRKIPTIS